MFVTEPVSQAFCSHLWQIGLPWAEKQIADARAWLHSVTLLHTLAQQSPSGEITLSLVPVSDDNYTL